VTVYDYLCAKYGVPRPTVMLYVEAKTFGIPWPLTTGWIGRYCDMPITADMAERLTKALEKKGNNESAKAGLSVLRTAHLELKRRRAPTTMTSSLLRPGSAFVTKLCCCMATASMRASLSRRYSWRPSTEVV